MSMANVGKPWVSKISRPRNKKEKLSHESFSVIGYGSFWL